MKKAIMENWKNFLKEDDWSLSSVGDDDHYGEPDDEKMAALTSLQAVLDQSDKEHMKSLVSALGECARAGIPAEDIIDTLALWADSE